MTVTEIEDDEPTTAQETAVEKKSSSFLTTDRVLAGTGIAIAFAAAMFPWYVFFNEEKFGVRVADWGRTRDLPEGPGRDVFSVSPLAMVDKDESGESEAKPAAFDPLVTATISQLGKVREESRELSEAQPFPGRSAFKLLHVANGRALIEDDSGMYLVRVGSVLPDNTRVATLEQRDGKWVIVTSSGEVYANQ